MKDNKVHFITGGVILGGVLIFILAVAFIQNIDSGSRVIPRLTRYDINKSTEYTPHREEVENVILNLLEAKCQTSISRLGRAERFIIFEQPGGEVIENGRVTGTKFKTRITSRMDSLSTSLWIASSDFEEKRPVVIFLHGLDLNPDVIFRETPLLRIRHPYSNEIGIRLVNEDYVVAAPFIFSDQQWTDNARYYSELTGFAFDNMLIANLMGVIDYLETRPYVDIDNIAVYGVSWGGTIARKWSSVDPRIKVTVISGNDFDPVGRLTGKMKAFRHQEPGHIEDADRPCEPTALSTLARISPRTLIIEAGEEDGQAHGLENAFELLEKNYEGELTLIRFPGGHAVNGGPETIDLIGTYLK